MLSKDSELKIFWENGRIKRSVQMRQGLRWGFDRMWNQEGQLFDETYYEKGRPLEALKPLDPTGQQTEEVALPFSMKDVSLTPQKGDFIQNYQKFMERFPKMGLLLSQASRVITEFEPLPSCHLQEVQLLYVYGLGKGAPYFQLKEWLEQGKQLVFLEEDMGKIVDFLHDACALEILSDCNVQIHDPSELREIAAKYPVAKIEILSLDSKRRKSFQRIKLELLRKTTLLHAYEYERTYGHIPFVNCLQNTGQMPHSFYANQMKNRFKGRPALICGAGSSLSEEVELLKALSDRALIIAGGSTLAALSHLGASFHFGMAIDPNLEELHRFKNNFSFEVPLLYSTRVYPEVFQTIDGPFGYMRTSVGGAVEMWLEQALRLGGDQIGEDLSSEAISVTTLCLAWAHFLGCNPIFFKGVDLAYTAQKRYADGVTFSDEETFQSPLAADQRCQRKSYENKWVSTTTRWVMEASVLSQFADTHRETTFYNLSQKGLKIDGIPHLPFARAMEVYFSQTWNVKSCVQEAISQAAMPKDTKQIIEKKLLELRASLDRVILHLQIITGKEKGSKALSEIELEEGELAMELLFHDWKYLSEDHPQKKWSWLLESAQNYRKQMGLPIG